MNIQIHFKQNKQTKRNISSNNRARKKAIIIIPKKNIKLANKRNKIRRQIRAILHKNKLVYDKELMIKYFEKLQKPEFKELEAAILTKICSFN